jgi:hypothetical protein
LAVNADQALPPSKRNPARGSSFVQVQGQLPHAKPYRQENLQPSFLNFAKVCLYRRSYGAHSAARSDFSIAWIDSLRICGSGSLPARVPLIFYQYGSRKT